MVIALLRGKCYPASVLLSIASLRNLDRSRSPACQACCSARDRMSIIASWDKWAFLPRARWPALPERHLQRGSRHGQSNSR
eukprot:2742375-Pyramimonas_sp.AAC.1